MKELKANSVGELQDIINSLDNGMLFRGQLEHYGEPGAPSVTASLDRQGCIPSETMKWSCYASKVLESLIGDHVNDFGYVQALLQHYGWRSFFVDCSSSPSVSAWFASHRYIESPGIDMCEDCGENFLWERKKFARYEFEDGLGHLYVIDKSIAAGTGLVDLAELTIEGFLPRTEVQKAWLLGPTQGNPVPKECFLLQITASRSIFREYAALNGLTHTDTLFPPTSKDPILKALLELPWREIESVRDPAFGVPVFKRALELPEYQKSFEKIASPSTAFYRGGKINEMFDSIETRYGPITNGKIIQSPAIIIYGTVNTPTPLHFPKIERLLRDKNYLAFEIDEIIKHPNMGYKTVYQKGVAIINHGSELFEVCELIVRHPGIDMKEAGLSTGWFYRKNKDGLWEREYHENDCNCIKPSIHHKHIAALQIAENLLSDKLA
ncbi:hypothetical protein [Pantoea sp. At-9b]|uniref:hypothetical protein n=1 Tax=Pantoea sp. (strain At-9b) TaxID=592316 RepID=UPI0001B40B1B|nr:hypothetical protein [Pantoea sp. At-9b]ADU73011.1 FRG domain protein [Pantoea sp. At-9b]